MKHSFLLLLALISTSVLRAEDVAQTKFTGSFYSGMGYISNPNVASDKDSSTNSTSFTSGTLVANTKKGENILATLKANYFFSWGDVSTNKGSAASSTPNSKDQVKSANHLFVQEANLWWKTSDSLNFKFGRQEFSVADGRLLGLNDYEFVPYAYEGVVNNTEFTWMKLQAFGFKQVDFYENNDDTTRNTYKAAGTSDPEVRMYGVAVDVKNLPDLLKSTNIHAIQLLTDKVDSSSAAKNETWIGLAAQGEYAIIDFRLNYENYNGKQFALTSTGTEVSLMGAMYDFELGANFSEFFGLRFLANYHYDTGNDSSSADKNNSYNPLNYNRHYNAGAMDVIGWGNSTYSHLGVTFKVYGNWDTGFHYYGFTRTTERAAAIAKDTGVSSAAITNAGGNSKDVGSEYDITVAHAFDGGITFSVEAGQFIPGAYIKNGSEKANLTKASTSIGFLF